MYRVILHERCTSHAPSLNITRCASSIKADIIFLDAQPSLGLQLFSATAPVSNITKEIEQLQKSFTHSFVIVYDNLSDDKLTSIQLAIPSGSMRFFSTPTVQAAAQVILMYAKLMTEKAKLDLQKQYFLAEGAHVMSSSQALEVLHESFSRMSVLPHDTALIATCLPSLAQVMAANHAEIHYQVPCEEAAARILSNFFNASSYSSASAASKKCLEAAPTDSNTNTSITHDDYESAGQNQHEDHQSRGRKRCKMK